MSHKHLPRLFAQALNEKRVAAFDEFIHADYNNHNSYVQPGPAGVKAFFEHYLTAFPDTTVVMDDVIDRKKGGQFPQPKATIECLHLLYRRAFSDFSPFVASRLKR